jgi:hypothetical protein
MVACAPPMAAVRAIDSNRTTFENGLVVATTTTPTSRACVGITITS